MIILGIETSCDETALSLLETRQEKDGLKEHLLFKVHANAVVSQIKLHEQYGGVFPMMAKREHAKNLVPLLTKVLTESPFLFSSSLQSSSTVQDVTLQIEAAKNKREKIKQLLGDKEKELLAAFLTEPLLLQKPAIDIIAVTYGPGLEPALWVGVNFAKALSILWDIDIIPVNHMEGHIVASLLEPASTTTHLSLKSLMTPALALLISGGHTELVLIKSLHDYEIIGKTRDDAVGEAFDKVARLLGFPYPGGPHISKQAQQERMAHPHPRTNYPLPRPMLHSDNYDFSFSGIKTSALYTLRKIEGVQQNGEQRLEKISTHVTDDIKQQLAREFEDAVTEVLVKKTTRAIETYGIQTLIIGGGVIANTHIRHAFEEAASKLNCTLLLPEAHLSTDNAVMIGLAGALIANETEVRTRHDFKAEGNLLL